MLEGMDGESKGNPAPLPPTIEEQEAAREWNVFEFERFCDRVGKKAQARGLTQEVLDDLLLD